MKNMRVWILFLWVALLLVGCGDGASTLTALEWPGMPEPSSEESPSFAWQSSSSEDKRSSSSVLPSDSLETVLSSSVPSSSWACPF